MAISHVANGTQAATGSSTTVTPGGPAGLEVDDILILVAHTSSQAALTVSGDWTEIAQGNGGSTTSRLGVWWHRYNGTPPNYTVTRASGTTPNLIAQVAAFRGCPNSVSPIAGVTAISNGTDNSIEVNAVTGAHEGAWHMCAVGVADDNALATGAGTRNGTNVFTGTSTSGTPDGAVYLFRRPAVPGVAVTMTNNMTASDPWAAVGFMLKASATDDIGAASYSGYPDPSSGATTVDGDIRAITTTWSTGRNNTVGSGAFVTDALFYSGEASSYLHRAFFLFNTAALGDGDTITNAYFSVIAHGTGQDSDNDGNDWVNIVQSSPASNNTLALEDFDQCGAINSPTEGSDRIDLTGNFAIGSVLLFTLNSTGRGWIDKTGVTKLGMREGHDVVDSEPSGDTYFYGSTSDVGGTERDPLLVVISGTESYSSATTIGSTGGVTTVGGEGTHQGTTTVGSTGTLAFTSAGAHAGTVTASGTSAITLVAGKSGASVVAVSGTGDATASGGKGAAGVTTASGTGGATASGGKATSGTATASGTGEIAATSSGGHAGSTSGSGAGGAALTGSKAAASILTASGSGAITITGTHGGQGAVTVSGSSAITAAGERLVGGSAAVSGTGAITGTATTSRDGSASVTGSGQLTATGTGTHRGAATVGGTGQVTGAGEKDADEVITITGTGQIAATGSTARSGATTIGATSDAVTTGRKNAASTVAVAGSGNITADGVRIVGGPVSVTGTGTITGTARTARSGSATVTGTGQIAPVGFHAGRGATTGSGASVLGLVGAKSTSGVASIPATGAIAATGRHAGSGTASVGAAGAITASGVPVRGGLTLVTGTGSATGSARTSRSGVWAVSGVSNIAGTARTTRGGAFGFARAGVCTITGTGWRFGSVTVTGVTSATAKGYGPNHPPDDDQPVIDLDATIARTIPLGAAMDDGQLAGSITSIKLSGSINDNLALGADLPGSVVLKGTVP